MATKVLSSPARHAVGVSFVGATVLFWTAGSFLASTIFADNTYSKPYFVTYFTTNMFTSFLFLKLAGLIWHRLAGTNSTSQSARPSATPASGTAEESERLIWHEPDPAVSLQGGSSLRPLNARETAYLALQFCILWFSANYFQFKSLEHTSVASVTILSSTSGIWTLALGAWLKVEKFSLRKLLGVLASLMGVAIIAFGDFSGGSDDHRGSFPHKSPGEIAAGDILALVSAALYGLYTTLLKKRIHDESRVDMLLFLGIVGLANTFLVWPGLVLLHFTGFETFEFPPTQRIWVIVLVNAAISVLGDLTWAYAVLYTTPVVVTIGLSLSIPLSIVGQFFLNNQSATISYWFGAAIVFAAFIFINKESSPEIVVEERQREE